MFVWNKNDGIIQKRFLCRVHFSFFALFVCLFVQHHEQSMQYNNRVLTIAIEQATKADEVTGYQESAAISKLGKQIQAIHDSLFKNVRDLPENGETVKEELKRVDGSIKALKVG